MNESESLRRKRDRACKRQEKFLKKADREAARIAELSNQIQWATRSDWLQRVGSTIPKRKK